MIIYAGIYNWMNYKTKSPIEVRNLQHIFSRRSMTKVMLTRGNTIEKERKKHSFPSTTTIVLIIMYNLFTLPTNAAREPLSSICLNVIAVKYRDNWINCFSCVNHAGQRFLSSLSPINTNSADVDLSHLTADDECSQGRVIQVDFNILQFVCAEVDRLVHLR